MKIHRLLLSAAIAAAFSATLFAQAAPLGYHRVACIKVKPGQGQAFHKWAADDPRKVDQAEVDSGEVSTSLLLRSVFPQGKSAECDYLAISMYPGLPPQPAGMEHLSALLKKAGLTETAQEYLTRRNSLATLISYGMFRNVVAVGTEKKGDYLRVNEMKVTDPEGMGDYIAHEKKVWQPLAEQMAKDGVTSGWSLNVRVLPHGSGLAYQAVTVDIFPSWDSVFKHDDQFVERFNKVHPGMDFGTTMENYGKLRTIVEADLYKVEAVATPTK